MILGLIIFSLLNATSLVSELSLTNDGFVELSKSSIFKTVSKPTEAVTQSLTAFKKNLLEDPKPMYEKIEPIAEKPKPESKPEIDEDDEEELGTQHQEKLSGFEIVDRGPLKTPLRFLIVGDSLVIQSFGILTEEKLSSYAGNEVYREGHYSTGLNRIDYYDWFAKTQELIDNFNPDVLIVFFGSNDGQNIVGYDGVISKWPSDGWDVRYRERIHKYMEEFSPQVKKIYWVGQPVPRDEGFNLKFTKMNIIYSSEAKLFGNIVFVDSWSRFAVNGVYAPIVADDSGLSQYVKASDGVHLTSHGGKILMEYLFGYMEKDIDFEPDN